MRARVIGTLLLCCAPCVLACGGSDDEGGPNGLVYLDIAAFDPSFEAYDGGNSDNIFENGYTLRIVAAGSPVHDGSVSVRFQDVEQQEIRVPSHVNPTKIPVVAGGTYVLHVWCYGIDVGGGAATTSVPIQFSANLYSGSSFFGQSPITTRTLPSFDSWQELTSTIVVPASVDRMYVVIKATAGVALNVDLYIDDLSIERTS